MSSILKHIPPYEELKIELENDENLKNYSNYESFIGEERAVNYLIKRLLEYDIKNNETFFDKVVKCITKKNSK
jgi:hypothetical protein